MKIEYFDFRGHKSKKMAKAALTPCLEFMPSWVKTISVFYHTPPVGEAADFLAQVYVDEPYRSASITIYPEFFVCSAEKQRTVMLHEVIHILIAHLVRWSEDKVLGFVAVHNEELFTYLSKEFKDRHEYVTKEIEFVLKRLVDKN